MVALAPVEIERLAGRLAKAVAMVESDPATLMGEPCIKGTRVPVYDIAALAGEVGIAETHETYPFLTVEQIELSMLFAGAYPRREPAKTTRLGRQKGKTRRGVAPLIDP